MTEASILPSQAAGKRERSKLANRHAILAGARAVFSEMGYEAATARDIIRRTNLSVGAFYNYFRSKEEVYEALSDDGARRFRPILQAQYEAATDFEGFIRGAMTAYFEFLVAEHQAWQEGLPPGERGPHVRPETPEMKAVFEQVRRSIADMLARGHGPQVDSGYLAVACIAVAREVGEAMLARRPLDVGGAVEFAVRMILGGVPALPQVET